MNPSQSKPEIERTRVIKGKQIFSIIKKGGSHFLIDMPVYEDGVFYCWEHVDLDGLRNKIQTGWVNPSVPDGEKLRIHNLGHYIFKESKWNNHSGSYYDYLLSIVQEMNPGLYGLLNAEGKLYRQIGNKGHDMFSSTYEKFVRNDGADQKLNKENYYSDCVHCFFHEQDDMLTMARLNVYNDERILMEGLNQNYLIDFDDLSRMVDNGILLTSPSPGSTIYFPQLGEVILAEAQYVTDVSDLVLEIHHIAARLNGNPTTSDKCEDFYNRYIKSPNESSKEELKEAYEMVPKHLRIYILGSLNRKDKPIREIIYGERV